MRPKHVLRHRAVPSGEPGSGRAVANRLPILQAELPADCSCTHGQGGCVAAAAMARRRGLSWRGSEEVQLICGCASRAREAERRRSSRITAGGPFAKNGHSFTSSIEAFFCLCQPTIRSCGGRQGRVGVRCQLQASACAAAQHCLPPTTTARCTEHPIPSAEQTRSVARAASREALQQALIPGHAAMPARPLGRGAAENSSRPHCHRAGRHASLGCR